MKTVLVLCPSAWDAHQLARARDRWAPHFRLIVRGGGVEDEPAAFDARAFVDQTLAQLRNEPVDGVTSSSDYPGCLVAAIIARTSGLPGPDVRAVFTCSHKYYSRVVQARAAPEATPRFALVTAEALETGVLVAHDGREMPYPVFVKPVKSWFSQHARRCDTLADLRRFATSPAVRTHLTRFVAPFNQLLRQHTDFTVDGGYLLAEECLAGTQVTLEGYVHAGRVHVLGIVDSVMHPGTICFQRFDYPSHLPPPVQRRMTDVAARVVPATGLDESLFNMELFWDPRADRVSIIEINPRMCGQFADLYEMVRGTNTYEVLLALATGQPPPMASSPAPYAAAASVPLRSFRDAVVRRIPTPEDVAAARSSYPMTLLKTYYRPGQCLSDEDQSDGYSHRYAVFNLAAPDHATLLRWADEIEHRLGFALEPLPAAAPSDGPPSA